MYSFTSNPFRFNLTQCEREPLSWLEETRLTARQIAEGTTKPIYVCMSGGGDSEVVAEAFLHEGIPFTALSFIHQSNGEQINWYDIKFARDWCKDNKVKHEFALLNFDQLLTDDVEKYAAEQYVTNNVFRYLQIRMLEEVENRGGYAVLGGGEQLYRFEEGRTEAFFRMDRGFSVPVEWCERNNTQHEPYFFFRSSELFLAWQNCPLVKCAVEHPEILVNWNNILGIRGATIRTFFPKQIWRAKYNGFETVLPQRKKAEERLQELFGSAEYYEPTYTELQQQLVLGSIQQPNS